jgi:hypothetical protein|tara:strand:+ start:219 stop:668 length:450 start_codon:yes stop_codon:yes gene_type:complete
MATLTIIKDDKFVDRDGASVTLDAVVLPANVHAIQWNGSSGWVEYNDGTHNTSLSNIDDYKTITDDYATKKAEVDAAEAAATKAANDAATKAANDRAAFEATYGFKRGREYATIEDQLDQLYKDMLAGKLDTTGTWATGVKAVKDKYPK